MLVKQSEKSMFSEFLKNQNSSACLPAVRPGCARFTDPEISDLQSNDGRLMNVMLFALNNSFIFFSKDN